MVDGQAGSNPKVRVADFHVSLCQEEAGGFQGRSRERPIQCLQDS